MENNKVCFEIDNCCDCRYCYKEPIYTPDPWEHEIGAYCSKVEDKSSYNRRHKLIAADDWNLEKYTLIPDWCPRLKNNLSTPEYNGE